MALDSGDMMGDGLENLVILTMFGLHVLQVRIFILWSTRTKVMGGLLNSLLSSGIFTVAVYCLIGIVVKASASGAEGPGLESCLRQDFSRLSHTSDLKIGTPVATLPGAWHYRVSAGTGQPGVSIL